MAGTLTHAYFSLDLFDRLGIRSKELVIDNRELLKTFSQSTDILYFYNITNLKKGKKIRDFGHYFQRDRTYDFFSTLINYIKYNNHQYNSEVMAFLYGMISHYVLDSTMHPYIIYKTGNFKKIDKSTYKYNHLHADLETYLDNYIVALKENIKPQKFKCYNFCFNVESFSDELIEVIDFTYKEVFGIDNFHKYFLTAIKQMKLFYRVFRYDPIGVKKCFYKVVDLVSPKFLLRKESLSYHINTSGKRKLLNLEHERWYNPTDKRTRSDKSLLELYTFALNKAEKMIKDINGYMYYDKKVNLKRVVGNNSYVTGKDCSKKKELKFFEF